MPGDASQTTRVQPVELSATLNEPRSVGKPLRILTLFVPVAIVVLVVIGAGKTILVVPAGSW